MNAQPQHLPPRLATVTRARAQAAARARTATGRARVGPRRARTARPRRPAVARIGSMVRVRIALVAVLLCMCLGGIGYKAFAISITGVEHYRAMAERQHVRAVEVPAPRGDIRDIRGRHLAITADTDSVYANPRKVIDVAATAEALAAIFELDVRLLESRLSSPRHFAWIARHVSASDAAAVRAAALPGIALTPEPRRFYPGKALAGPLLGFAGIDGNGLDGLELKMDGLLTGRKSKFARAARCPPARP